ncbi:hypothetical protein [Arthrobacter sp. NicSoilB11]|uniref:hypothetical protein n=1 Tax=Arthrobacter sp. NicSoilB11 TaxID=2830999 RepID=UPI001CC7DF73|nr:hypothetical protein [Arthrobacter sp. NicSoilB11]BCW75897.1 hypothetical protein NicSoilB11_22220 [Arthrobacter sp. NicSoilB11]
MAAYGQVIALTLNGPGIVYTPWPDLAELWDNADEPEWRESLEDLKERLRTALR